MTRLEKKLLEEMEDLYLLRIRTLLSEMDDYIENGDDYSEYQKKWKELVKLHQKLDEIQRFHTKKSSTARKIEDFISNLTEKLR